MTTEQPSSPGPSKRPSKWDAEDEQDDHPHPAEAPSIKRRLVRPKKLRRPGDNIIDESSPGLAGPSSPPSNQPPRRSASPQLRRSPSPSPETSEIRPPVITGESRSPTHRRRAPTGPASLHPPRSALAPPRSAHPPLLPCRSVYSYTRLNHIEEGTYGVVFRAKCNDTGGIYALKKLKLEEEKHGFPITSLREVMALMAAGAHENVVGIREIVVGDTLNQ